MSGQPSVNENSLKAEANAALPEEISQVLEGVPPAQREVIERFMISQVSMISRISPEIEVSKKITAEHITTMLNTQDKAMERTFRDNTQKRWYSIALVVLSCAVLIALVVLLKDIPETMEKIITIVLSGLLGGAGGYGLGVNKRRDNE